MPRTTTTLALALAASALVPAAASAHTIPIAVACERNQATATFRYEQFDRGPFSSVERLFVDRAEVLSSTRSLVGPGGGPFVVAYAVPLSGRHALRATAEAAQGGRMWTGDSLTRLVECGSPPPGPDRPPTPSPTPPEETPPGPPASPPPPPVVPPGPPASPPAPRWVLSKVGPARARVGSSAFYRVRIRNTGRVAIRGAVLVDLLPLGLAVASTVPSGGRVEAGAVRWNLPVLRPGRSITRSVRLRVTRAGVPRVCNVAAVVVPSRPILRARTCAVVPRPPTPNVPVAG